MGSHPFSALNRVTGVKQKRYDGHERNVFLLDLIVVSLMRQTEGGSQ